eukprot:5773636-Amphidinium_carterae.1
MCLLHKPAVRAKWCCKRFGHVCSCPATPLEAMHHTLTLLLLLGVWRWSALQNWSGKSQDRQALVV